MFSSIAPWLLLLQFLCAHLVASQYLLGTLNTKYYIAGTGLEDPGEPVRTVKNYGDGPPPTARALVVYPPLEDGRLSAIYDRYTGLFIAPYDAGTSVKLSWHYRPFLWRIVSIGDGSHGIFHPDRQEFFWYHDLDVPGIILGYKSSTATDGDAEWSFQLFDDERHPQRVLVL